MFKLITGNESSHEISNDNGVKLVNFATSKNLRVKGMMFPHHNIHKYEYSWTSPDEKTHNRIDHILVGRHSNIQSFGVVDCDSDYQGPDFDDVKICKKCSIK
jgi:hypothetical protein